MSCTGIPSKTVSMSLTKIHGSLSASGCSATIDGTGAAAHNGMVKATYMDTGAKLKVLTTGGNLHLFNVNCFGVINNGDSVNFTTTYTLTASNTVTLNITLAPAVYTITATVGGSFKSSPSASLLVPVYDASTFATGGGYAVTTATTTPAGAIALPAGKKANFGFNVKYKSGTAIPTGSLLFQLKEGSIDLKATGVDWLVISGGRAEFQGTATINGSGAYAFRIIATQGSATVADRFEIRIWSAGGSFDAPTYIVSNTVGGGSIRVH